jgi:diacylglycerol kinase family enzyme
MDCEATMSSHITVVYNPRSGSAISLAELRKLCKKHGFIIDQSIPIKAGFIKKVDRAVHKHATILAIGGDGTVSSVAGRVAGTKATLIPIPGGTFNNFTKDLGIPQVIDEAFARAAKAKPRLIDIASVNDLYFVNNSAIGLYPESLQTRKRTEDRFGKWPAAMSAVVLAFVRYQSYLLTIDDDTVKTPFIYIGNNPYRLNGLELPRRTKLNTGVLSIFYVKTSTRMGLVKLFFVALLRKLDVEESFAQYTPTEITITSKHRSRVSVSHDGELSYLETPLVYKIHKKALRVLY